jgi:UDP-N-acetylmuramyl pentapeptide phosphotransferase/UDP-N-acetylglucosamine-1-phosphate transferase
MNVTLSIISLSLSILLIFTANRFFIKKKFIDQINLRSSHDSIATRSGGISIFFTVFIISCTSYLLGNTIFDFSILVPLSLLVLIGCYDDIYNIDFKLKFIFQVIAAKIIIDNGLLIDNFHGVFGLFEINRVFAQLFTIFVILSIINSINFIDGIDGLAISVVGLFILFFEFFSSTGTPYFNLSNILLSSIIPLYYFNFRKSNKVFLGDSGSHFLGGVVSIYVIFILSQDYIIQPQYDIHKIIYILSIIFYPIIDIIRVVTLRLLKGVSPFLADKNHIHHFLLNKQKNHLIVVITIIFLTLAMVMLSQLIL